MRAVDGNNAEHVQVFVENHDLIKPLHDLPLIGNKVGEGHAGGHASGIDARVGGAANDLIFFRSGLERGLEGVAAEGRIVDARQIRFAVWHTRGFGARRSSRTGGAEPGSPQPCRPP